MNAPSRPAIDTVKTGEELKRWYWLKTELVDFARKNKIPVGGYKPELTQRLADWLDTGVVQPSKRRAKLSSFNWGSEVLTLDTLITDSYRNSQNVRAFMKTYAASSFKFSNEFMDWMKNNVGATLGDAVIFWQELDRLKREESYREKPLPQNQYNQFSRELSRVSPGIPSTDIRRLWAIKRAGPGPHIYKPGDEKFPQE